MLPTLVLGAIALGEYRPSRANLPAASVDAKCIPPKPNVCDIGLTQCTRPNGTALCVNLQTDNRNCGSCNSICDGGVYIAECREGKCICTDNGQEACPGQGCPYFPRDVDHCGACFNAVSCHRGRSDQQCGPNQGCLDGQCYDCPADWKRCAEFGCIDILNDINNCGDCSVRVSSAGFVPGGCGLTAVSLHERLQERPMRLPGGGQDPVYEPTRRIRPMPGPPE
jgi:hypothetical protein